MALVVIAVLTISCQPTGVGGTQGLPTGRRLPYVKHVMLTVRDMAQLLGTSERGVRLRIDALRPWVDVHLRRGPNNQVLLDDAARAALERLEALRKADHLSVTAAAELVKKELLESEMAHGRAGANVGQTSVNPWEMLVEELRAEVRRLKEENEWLKQRIESLERLALPAPRRGSWWRLLWARLTGGGASEKESG